MNAATIRHNIQIALAQFQDQALGHSARQLLAAIGYRSDLGLDHEWTTVETFLQTFDTNQVIDPHRALVEEWQEIDFLFQLTEDEINTADGINVNFDRQSLEPEIYQSYLFFALKLNGSNYNRTELSNIVREINRLTPIPSMVIFAYGSSVTIAVIDRRPHRRDESRDVLEKITLIKDIDTFNPHRAHIEILVDLSLSQLIVNFPVENFLQLHRAWQSVLNTSELNKRFYRELSDWYFWAVKEVTFPSAAGEDPEVRNATSVIRLITRLMFVWFLKEKGLIPVTLFRDTVLDHLLHNLGPEESTYYKAILQNLFFATLNQEMDSRSFCQVSQEGDNITNLYRYADYFVDTDQALQLFASIPFLNGGLFECLDKLDFDQPGRMVMIDGFSDRADNPIEVPNFLFFSQQREVDLNEEYGTTNQLYKVQGLIHIFKGYKFTVTENTPLEEEVALDPELLGRVFENLLASYNPETRINARNQTGSFYTPRQIVSYMVDESLISYLLAKLVVDHNRDTIESKLKHLISFTDETHQFNQPEIDQLIQAIDSLKILDPACGSGAFPMGVLQKLVFILSKLDPNNQLWRMKQLDVAQQISDPLARNDRIQTIQRAFDNNALNYGRKLYLIQRCIYGVDIQPIAVQIAKLRCFISLIVDQTIDDDLNNRGILPLPNLEAKFVAANTLVPVDQSTQYMIRSAEIDIWEDELINVRQGYFVAYNVEEKNKHRDLDSQIRTEIVTLLHQDGFPSETTERIAGWDPYDQNIAADFFDPEWMFNCKKGFDIVIGNPPYISHDQIPEDLKTEIETYYESYESFSDLYCYFIERSINLQNEAGILTFITSNSYLRADYGQPIRKFLRRKNVLLRVLSLEDTQVFDAAIVNVSIIVSQKPYNQTEVDCLVVNSAMCGDNFEEFIASRGFYHPQSYFDSESWNLLTPTEFAFQRRLATSGRTLEQLGAKIRLGIATGYNRAFLIDGEKREQFLRRNSNNSRIIKHVLRGRDIQRYAYILPPEYILLTQNGVDVENDYPDIYRHFESFGEKFQTRGARGNHWTNLRACSFYEDFHREKIVWIELADVGRFALCREEVYLLNSAYFLLPPANVDSKLLLGILNSSTICCYLNLIAATSGMGTNRWINRYVKQFPVPPFSLESQEPIIGLVNEIIVAKDIDVEADTTDLEQQIDQLVYQLYDLTDEEIAIIEESTSRR
jgi:hypothetical protein